MKITTECGWLEVCVGNYSLNASWMPRDFEISHKDWIDITRTAISLYIFDLWIDCPKRN